MSWRAWSNAAAPRGAGEEQQRRGGGAGGTERVKVQRYFPGKAPRWAPDAEGGAGRGVAAPPSHDLPPLSGAGAAQRPQFPAVPAPPAQRQLESEAEEAPIAPRVLKRSGGGATRDDSAAGSAQAAAAATTARGGLVESDSEDEDEIERRRARARARQQAAVAAPAAPAAPQAVAASMAAGGKGFGLGDEESEESGSSEYETDSEADEEGWFGGVRAMAKPTFVSAKDRATVRQREAEEAAAAAAAGAAVARKAERKEETRRLVVEEVQREAAAAEREAEEDAAQVDTDDDRADAEDEYSLWRERELARLMEDFEAALRIEERREEVERVRSMDDETRRAYEAVVARREGGGAGKGDGDKSKIGFLQKYYHKGAFFQADADDAMQASFDRSIYDRDFNQATGDDKLDKSLLPEVMQVKNFGKMSRSKWTHLSAEDTSRPRDDDLRWGGAMRRGDRERHEQRRGGSGGAGGARADFARPAVKRGRYGDDQRQDERHYDEGRREERRYDDRERR